MVKADEGQDKGTAWSRRGSASVTNSRKERTRILLASGESYRASPGAFARPVRTRSLHSARMILSENSDVLNCTVPPLRVESSELKHPISPMTMWPPSASRCNGWPHIPPIYRQAKLRFGAAHQLCAFLAKAAG